MPRNTIDDLKNHLFAQLEQLGDEDCTKTDIEKAKAMAALSKEIINASKLQLSAMKFAHRVGGMDENQMRAMLPKSKDDGK